MTNTNHSHSPRVAENIVKRNYSWLRSPLHAAVACMLFAGMSGLMSAQIGNLPHNKIAYKLTDLNAGQSAFYGTPPYDFPISPPSPWWGNAFAIDNAGQAVGQFVDHRGAYHAFRTEPNMPIDYYADDLGVLNGTTSSLAFAVNSTGVVVGESGNRAISSVPGYGLDDLNTTSPPRTCW
jgi:probable HAF family extracellular repeat protein